MPRQLKPRTHAAGTMTKARYFQFIRSALRAAMMKYPSKQAAKKAARKAVKGKRHRFEYKCAECKKFYLEKETQVDHIVGAGSLKEYTDLPGFVERLFCEPEGLQVLCKPCHKVKTAEERKKR